HLSQPLHIPHSPVTRCLVLHFKRKHSHWISHDLAFRRITFSSIILRFRSDPVTAPTYTSLSRHAVSGIALQTEALPLDFPRPGFSKDYVLFNHSSFQIRSEEH